MLGLYVAARWLGLDAYLSAERIRELVSNAGALGPVMFVGVFVAAVVAQVPGVVFVMVAPALFPWFQAWLLCMLASNLSVLINFELVRRIGGQTLSADVQRPWMRRAFDALDAHPIRSVMLLRIVTIMFPPVTGALALTQISAKHHAVGSALGMALPVTLLLLVAAFLFG
jgi:uncharacterized membrane protein YdjX (TVP38/TMEM64 family)